MNNCNTHKNIDPLSCFKQGVPVFPKGDKGDKGEQGIQGFTGKPGIPGKNGESATIEIGSVTSLNYNDPATISNSGTSTNAIFNFGIPEGKPGKEITSVQTTSTELATGDYVNTITYNDGSTDTFKSPKGAKGEQGSIGISPTITVGTVTKLPCNVNPTVTNVGNQTNAVFNFGIPGCSKKNLAVSLTANTGNKNANELFLYKIDEPLNLNIITSDGIPTVITNNSLKTFQYNIYIEVQMDSCASKPKFTITNLENNNIIKNQKTIDGITSANSGTYHLRTNILITGKSIPSDLYNTINIKSSVSGNLIYSHMIITPIVENEY